jgi:hypothetical protein
VAYAQGVLLTVPLQEPPPLIPAAGTGE